MPAAGKSHRGTLFVEDAEAPLPVEQRVQVPDGFLRSRATAMRAFRASC